jgi:Flp pilus assembly protein TadG
MNARQVPTSGIWRAAPELPPGRRLRLTPATFARVNEEGGQAIVEFTLILPIFVGLIFIAIGFGITLNNYLRVADVARVAARDAAIARFSGQPNPCTAAIAAANEAAGGLTFSETPTCTTPGGNTPGQPISVTVKINSQNAIRNIPFMSYALPDILTSTATVLLQ